MYAAFDRFLAVETWHTTHALDDQRFYKVLGEVVTSKGFNPDDMGNYFREQKGNAFAADIDRRVAQAWSVFDYLVANPQHL